MTIPQLLEKYELIYNEINSNENFKKIYPGNTELISHYKKISNPSEADFFFERFGVGNISLGIHIPFERQIAYEMLLDILKNIDPLQYYKIHKGTPYYFIGWTAYQYRDFAKAIFYMDAAVSEDLKFPEVQNKISIRPSLEFFLLKKNHGPSGLDSHLALRNVVENNLKIYHDSGGGSINIDDFSKNFVEDVLYSGQRNRSLLTALYTFLLEYQEKEKQINLRSDRGGTIQPFLDHLFDGARLLESLLEKKGAKGTLRPKIIKTHELSVKKNILKSDQTLIDAECEFNNQVSIGSTFQDCNFASAFIIRNTTGHSLLWPDQFNSNSLHNILYKTLINSIFWTVEKLWL